MGNHSSTVEEDSQATENKGGQFKALKNTEFLSRYQYHRFLVNWFIKGLQDVQEYHFPQTKIKECPIVIGGEVSENLSILLGKSTGTSLVSHGKIKEGVFLGTDILVVYFLGRNTESVPDKLIDFFRYSSVGKGTILFVMHDDGIIDESLKFTLIFQLRESHLWDWQFEFVSKKHLEVITVITCILEKRLFDVLKQTQRDLQKFPLTENVETSLLEVNAILRRLEQAACFPNLFPEEVKDFPRSLIDHMLEKFGDKILWHGFDGDTLHIITNDLNVKKMLESSLAKSEFKHIKHSIKVQDKLSVHPLANTGVPLHGAKFVYVSNGFFAFLQDKKFATTGSLMTANDSIFVAITSRHAFNSQENIYVLIDKSVVKLGHVHMHSQQPMERLCEDITLVELDPDTVPIVNERCEKLLIDATDLPTPGRISPRELRVGDIVHKRGAKTGLTTGIVKSVQINKLGGYQVESPVIQICGRRSEPFAAEGDSGALVFQHSLSPDENVLDVLAMVQSKLSVPVPNAPVICFPFTKGCETLYRVVPGLQTLQFANF